VVTGVGVNAANSAGVLVDPVMVPTSNTSVSIKTKTKPRISKRITARAAIRNEAILFILIFPQRLPIGKLNLLE
jgi:hypothetical protein